MVSWKSSSVSVGNPQIISVAMVIPGTLENNNTNDNYNIVSVVK